MTALNKPTEVLHRIRVRLYPNHLPSAEEGAYIARTCNERVLSVEEVCAAYKTRGGFTGSYSDLVRFVHGYIDESMYQLCDGYAVSTGYYTIHPNVGGTFDQKAQGLSPHKPPISFRFRSLSKLHRLAEYIEVFVEGVMENPSFIDDITDITTGMVNEVLSPGGTFLITGRKIKVSGDPQDTGVYFTSPESPDVKATGNLSRNTASTLLAITPELDPGKDWTVEVRTNYSGSSKPLKAVRVIKSRFTVTRGNARD